MHPNLETSKYSVYCMSCALVYSNLHLITASLKWPDVKYKALVSYSDVLNANKCQKKINHVCRLS